MGKGSFGQVVKVKNNLDGKTYAIKKIRLRRGDQLNKIIREVTLLSQVHHKNCLRYYQAWLEDIDEEDDVIADEYVLAKNDMIIDQTSMSSRII